MSIKTYAITGIKWATLISFVVRMSRFVVTLILAKMLTPEAFGVLAIGLLIVNVLNLFREVGLGAALIQKQEEIEETADTTFFILIIISLIIFSVTGLMSHRISHFFNNNISIEIINIFAFSIVITSVSKVHVLMLQKELLYKKQAIAEISSIITYCFITISLALKNFQVWSLVFGYIFSEFVRSLMFIIVSNWHPTLRFSPKLAKEMLQFGKHVFGSTLLNYIFHNMDQFIVGKFLGNSQIGFYSFGYRISNFPAQNVTKVMGQITISVYSKIQNDVEKIKKAYFKSFKLVSFISTPLLMAFFFLIPDFFHLYYGQKWDEAIPVMKVLAFYGFFRSLGGVTGNVFIALGKPFILVRIAGAQLLLVIVPIFLVLKKFGITGIAVIFTFSMVFGVVVAIRMINKLLIIRWIEYVSCLKSAISSTIISFLIGKYVFGFLFNTNQIEGFFASCGLIVFIFFYMNYLFDKKFMVEITNSIGFK